MKGKELPQISQIEFSSFQKPPLIPPLIKGGKPAGRGFWNSIK
jgi:hypothetical protein